MGNFSSKNSSEERHNRAKIAKDTGTDSKAMKSETTSKLEQPIEPIEPEKQAKKDEEHHIYTTSETLATKENFQTIRRFLEKYHRAMNDHNVDRFLKILDQMKPLEDETSKGFIREFNGSEGLANQHLLSLQNILTLWERESLSRYLKYKSEQNRLLVTEATLKTIQDQDKQREFFYSKYDRKSSDPKGKEEKKKMSSKTTVSFVDNPNEMELKDANDSISKGKERLDALVLIESLHYRAIRELIRINKANIALIQYLKPSFDETTSSS